VKELVVRRLERRTRKESKIITPTSSKDKLERAFLIVERVGRWESGSKRLEPTTTTSCIPEIFANIYPAVYSLKILVTYSTSQIGLAMVRCFRSDQIFSTQRR